MRKLRPLGDKNLHFLDATGFLGKDYWDCSVALKSVDNNSMK